MLNRLKYINWRDLFQRENLGIIVVALFGLWVVWNTMLVVIKNNNLRNQISELRESVAILELENRNLELGITYYQTDDYLESAVRDDLLLRAPGEQVAIAPRTRNAPYNPFPEQNNTQSDSDKSNFAQWIDFLLGRS